MGDRQYTQRGRRGRPGLRRAVLLTVLGVLAGVVFLCARSGEPHVRPGAYAGGQEDPRAHAVCASPYDLPGCSPLTHVIPGVLPVPPPAVTVAGGEPSPAAGAAGAGRVRPPGPLARAPDLHALQVLRT